MIAQNRASVQQPATSRSLVSVRGAGCGRAFTLLACLSAMAQADGWEHRSDEGLTSVAVGTPAPGGNTEAACRTFIHTLWTTLWTRVSIGVAAALSRDFCRFLVQP